MPVIEGASNFTVSGDARLYEIHGNAVINQLADANEAKKIQLTVNLPRAQASHKDYETKKKSGPCFPGTRQALLREMTDWMSDPGESRMYVLSGLAGIGKSTVVYTLATQAAELGLLGASFFFSRDEADRRTAKKFFTTIAFQLCVYDETFSKAIGDILMTECGAAATTQDPQTQLKVLILDPLRSIVQSRARPILVVVDALDECDEDDEHAVVMGLSQLVRLLPSFRVILTTRPQPLVDYLFGNHDGHKILRLQDIEDKVVDGDIRLYLSHSFSQDQVRLRLLNLKGKWCASDEEIDSLVQAAGRLFIIASTVVRYIFNKFARNPAAQMQKLLRAFAQDRTPFKDLDHFYAIILRNVVPENCDDDEIVNRYRSVVGAIIAVQRPLPVSTLTHLVAIDVDDIHAVLDHLQSVILLDGDDVPRVYHKSFPDSLTDQARCKNPLLRIDPRICHVQIATRCFEIMDKHLKYNILGLGDWARFMNNEDGLKEDGITDEQLEEKIPQQLHYSCVYWANHLGVANVEDADLINGLEKFVDEHMLHWLEVLSLIGKLDSAIRAIRVALALLKSTSSDLHQLLSDALRFIPKFYELINRSALHIYYSALHFTPTNSLLYRRYIKESVHNICGIEGGPEKWDAHVATLSHEEYVDVAKFSLDSALFISCSEGDVGDGLGKLKIWDAATGAPISTIPGHRFAVANDFSTVASSEDNIITYYNVNGSAMGTMITTSSRIQTLAFSSESSRVAAALVDGTVWLWDSGNAELIDRFDDRFDDWSESDCSDDCSDQSEHSASQLYFSPTGTRLAYYSLANGIVKLRDGISGRFIADLRCGSRRRFEFSGDGSRIASLSEDYGLTLWDSESGGLIGVEDFGPGDVGLSFSFCVLAISANGSLLATADHNQVRLWSDSLAQFKVLELEETGSMAFSLDNILAIATDFGISKLYNVKTHSFISSFPIAGIPIALAFSPDCTRLAVGGNHGSVYLWNVQNIDACGLPSITEASAVSTLALSRDCSRLACGFRDGTVELWRTSPTQRRIASHQAHTDTVRALGFGPDGGLFASGQWRDGTIKLWNGGDGALRGTLIVPSELQAVALSNSVLVAGCDGGVTLWSLDTLSLTHTFMMEPDDPVAVAIAENNVLIAVVNHTYDGFSRSLSLLDVVNHTTIATFAPGIYDIHTMTFLPDNSWLMVQTDNGDFRSYNLINKHTTEGPALEHLIQLPNTPLWHGVPVWHCQDNEHHYLSALFSHNRSPVPVLLIPRDLAVTRWTQGLSMIVLGCEDGRIILVRLPINHAG
ncbi:hypothetical protein M378DRAFT_800456 [Amanita muscaria Koide BX008]|uniref:NACHT domain-containing protein n=1 Tax=Amanita muscaria (strain Koide BX008) TaxID=946122 RepID=A0A0C2X0R8_AMAMK|nr:hypothetical protein M378DRAFT_800456 [Amanita muscaria Koide BX008]